MVDSRLSEPAPLESDVSRLTAVTVTPRKSPDGERTATTLNRIQSRETTNACEASGRLSDWQVLYRMIGKECAPCISST
jgi:hypothetical protein